jgi:hypothetical protein
MRPSECLYEYELMVLILPHLSRSVLDEFAAAQDRVIISSVPRPSADQFVCVSQYLRVTFGLVAVRVSKQGDYLVFGHTGTKGRHLFAGDTGRDQ